MSARPWEQDWQRYCEIVTPVKYEHYVVAVEDAALGVFHDWTATRCPAYNTLNPSDCTCRMGDQ